MNNGKNRIDASMDQTVINQRQCDELGDWIDEIQDGHAQAEPKNSLLALANDLWQVGNHAAEQSQTGTSKGIKEPPKPEIDGYEIESLIGRGGMGLVYRAMDAQLKRNVAIKILPANVVGSDRARKRFQVEVQAAAQLEHPGIVPVYAFGEYPGGLFYTMREITGVDLSRKLRANAEGKSTAEFGPTIDVRSADYRRWVARIGRQLAEALAHSHEHLIVHRDVKPANVLIDSDGNAMLSDFGLARINEGSDLTGADDVMGTVLYMSPEQTDAGDVVDGRTDVYSLGITLYELLTEKTAITESGFAAAWKQINDGRIQKPRQLNPLIERDLETIVLKAIAPEPEARYASAQEMADDLGRFLDVVPIKARRATAGLRLARWARRNSQWVTTLGVVASCLLAVIFGLAIYSAKTSARDAETIRDQTAELLDRRGVELLKKGDARRAATAFREAADLTQDETLAKRQLRRVDAIAEWSPKLHQQEKLGGRLLADLANGSRVISRRKDKQQECVFVSGNDEKVLFATDRNIQFGRKNKDATKIALVIGDRTNVDPEIKLYDVERQHLETIATGITWRVTNVWFMPDNRSVVITGWGGKAIVWDAEQQTRSREVTFPSSFATSPAWVYNATADQNRTVMVAATNPGQLIAYSLPDLKLLWEEPKSLGRWTVDALAISPDGQWVAAGTLTNKMRLWHIGTGTEITLNNNVAGEPTIARFSGDSRTLAVGDDRGGVYLWTIPDGSDPPDDAMELMRRGFVMQHEYAIVSLDFNNNDDQLLVGSGNSARAWRLSDYQPLTPHISIDETLYYASWSETDSAIQLLSGLDSNNTRWTWRMPSFSNVTRSETGSVQWLLSTGHEQRVEAIVESEAASNEIARHPLSPQPDAPRANAIVLPSTIKELAFAVSADERRLTNISGTEERPVLHVVDRDTLEPLQEPTQLPPFTDYPRLNSDGSKWIANNFNNTIVIGDVASGEIQHKARVRNWVVDARLLNDGQFAAVSWDYCLRIWNARGSEVAQFEQSTRPELMTSIGPFIAVTAFDRLYVYEQSADGQWFERHKALPAGERVQVLSISPGYDRILTCGAKGTSRLWSIDGNVIAEFTGEAPIFNCRFSPDGRWLATVSEAGSLQIRNAQTGELMGPTIRGKTPIAHIAWTKAGIIIAGNEAPTGYWLARVNMPESLVD